MLQRLADDEAIPFSLEELTELISDYSSFTGRAEQQVMEYLDEVVYPLLEKNKKRFGTIDASLNV